MNPVLRKDIIGLLRLHRVAAIQLFFVTVLAVLVLASWPQQGIVSLANRGHDTLLLGLMLGQLILLVLFVPGVAAVSITSERERGTLEMLYASRLSPLQLIVGKLLSAVSYPFLLLISGLPFVALLHYRGDVDIAALTWAYLIMVVSAILLAVLSLAISAWCRQSSTALIASYITVLITCGGVLVPAAIMLASQGGLSASLLHYLRSISPVAAILSLLRPQLADLGGRAASSDQLTGEVIAGLPPAWQIFLPFAAVLILAGLVVLASILRKPPTAPEWAASGVSLASRLPPLARRLLFLIDPNKPRKPFGDWNPVMAKELRTNPLGSGGWMIRIFYGALFVSLGLAAMALYGGQTEHGDLLRYVTAILVAFQIGVISLIAPSLTSSAISSEVESGTFETLRMTPLRPRQLFWGKFLPAFLPAMLPIIALLPAYAAVCLVNPIYVRSFMLLMPVFVLAVALACSTGLFCSTVIPDTARATIANYLIYAAVIILPLLVWFAAGSHLDQRVASRLAMPSPLVIGLNLLPNGSTEVARFWDMHLILIGASCLATLVLARWRLRVLLRRG